MNIALVSLQYGTTATGGGGVHVNRITEEYISQGHNVSIITMHTAKTESLGEFDSINDIPFSIETENTLEVYRILLQKGLSNPYASKDKIEEFERIKAFCDTVVLLVEKNSDRFDVVHLHGHHMVPGYLAERLKDSPVKVFSTIHFLESTLKGKEGVDHINNMPDELFSQLKKWEVSAAFADGTVVISPGQKKDFRKLLEEHEELFDIENKYESLHLISSGVEDKSILSEDEIADKWKKAEKHTNILSYSRLDPSKGLHFALRALPEISAMMDNSVALTVAGIPAQGYEKTLDSECKKVENKCDCNLQIFKSIYTPEERNAFMDKFDIYLFPTLSEPFGITLIETAARGMLVISTDTDGPSYILGSNNVEEKEWGYITEYGINVKLTDDYHKNLVGNLEKSLKWFIENRDRALEMTLNFRKQIIKKFTWSGVVQQYLDMYSE